MGGAHWRVLQTCAQGDDPAYCRGREGACGPLDSIMRTAAGCVARAGRARDPDIGISRGTVAGTALAGDCKQGLPGMHCCDPPDEDQPRP